MSPFGSDWNGLLWLLVFFLLILPAMQGRFGGRRERWRERMDEWKERGEQRREEDRAFRDQLIAELRRHNAVAERQNELMAQAIERLNKTANASEGDARQPLSPEI